MFSKTSLLHGVSSKFRLISLSIFLTILLQGHSLEADGWGKTNDVKEYESESWNKVYFDMNGLYFTALIPNSSGGILQSNNVSLPGRVKTGARYVIITPFNQKFESPQTDENFTKIIQDANPTYIVTSVEGKNLGATHVVDARPKKQEDHLFYRFLFAHDHLVRMVTNDVDMNRRQMFFESIRIKSS